MEQFLILSILLWIVAGFFIAIIVYVKLQQLKRKLTFLVMGILLWYKAGKDKNIKSISWSLIKLAFWEKRDKE